MVRPCKSGIRKRRS